MWDVQSSHITSAPGRETQGAGAGSHSLPSPPCPKPAPPQASTPWLRSRGLLLPHVSTLGDCQLNGFSSDNPSWPKQSLLSHGLWFLWVSCAGKKKPPSRQNPPFQLDFKAPRVLAQCDTRCSSVRLFTPTTRAEFTAHVSTDPTLHSHSLFTTRLPPASWISQMLRSKLIGLIQDRKNQKWPKVWQGKKAFAVQFPMHP